MFKKNNPGCNCCLVACDILTDTFTRSNNSSLGSDWTETDWSIVSNRASTTTSNANAITVATASSSKVSVYFTLTFSVVNAAIRAIFNWVDDSNYLFVEFIPAGAAGACGTIKFYERASGVNTQVGTTREFSAFTTGTSFDVSACYANGHADAYLISTTRTVRHETDGYTGTYSGRKAGFGTGTITGTVTVDNFNFQHHELYNECDVCSGAVPCATYRDEFTRADATNLGCEWDEAAGNWDVFSNTLRCQSSNGCALNLAAPRTSEHSVACRITSVSTGDELRLIIKALDEDNYLFGQITFGATNSTLSIGSRIGGVETITISMTLSGYASTTPNKGMRLCYYGNTLFAHAENLAIVIGTKYSTVGTLAEPFAAPGDLVGVGTGTIGSSIRIDDFETFNYLVPGSSCVVCDNKCTICDKRYQPYREYVVDLGVFGATDVDCSGGCAGIGGEYTLISTQNAGASCGFSYLECGLCVIPSLGSPTKYMVLSITLAFISTGTGQNYAQVSVRFSQSLSPTAPCATVGTDPPAAFAVYRSAQLTNSSGNLANCQFESASLTKISSSTSYCNASGLPTTITLTRAS